MEFRVLGHLQVLRDGQSAHLDTAYKPRLLLAILLANIGQPLTLDELVEALWIESPPSSARRNIHQYIHRLRSNLGASILASTPGGYMVSADASVDSLEFMRLRGKGTDALAANDLTRSSEILRAALGLWRGDAFAGFRDSQLIAAAASKLDRARLAASEQLADIEIRLGNGHSVVEMLAELAEANPFQESLQALWMRSLHANGRQAEALEVFRRTRTTLVEQLGVEPGGELRAVQKAILTGTDLSAPPVVTPVIPRELPAAVTSFTGREKALVELDSMLARDPGQSVRPLVIGAISGMAGVGKTALAVFWGHHVASKFPDGQIYINLRGYADSEPVTTIAALSHLLGSLGFRPEQIPVDVSDAAARYRSALADRRILVVLDNARSAAQVRPLLPGSAGCLALITSRDRLTDLVAVEGAQRVVLHPLTTAESIDLLRNLVGDELIAAELEAVEELASICAGLPLAIRIAAAQVVDDSQRSLASYANSLRTRNLAISLHAGPNAVQGAFESSYRALPRREQLVFRRLGLVPLKDFTAEITAQLCELAETATAEALECLANAHLAERREPGRYALHDLLREYATALGEDEESDVDRLNAKQRLFDWFVACVHAAADRLYPDFVRATIPIACARPTSFDDTSARTWLESERANLATAVAYAAKHGPHAQTWILVDGLRGYYNQQRYTAEFLQLCQNAVWAARAAGDLQGEAAVMIALAQACYFGGRYASSITYLRRAVNRSKQAGWTVGEASSAANLGLTLNTVGALAEATDWMSHSISVYDGVEGRPAAIRKAKVFCSLATLLSERGDVRAGISAATEAISLCEGTGFGIVRAQALQTLGELYLEAGSFGLARDALQTSVNMYGQFDKPTSTSTGMIALALVELHLGDLGAARALADSAHSLALDLQQSLPLSNALNAQARIASADGRHDIAIIKYEQALKIARRIRALRTVTEAHLGLAETHCIIGQLSQAHNHHQQAEEICTRSGYRILHGKALLAEARIHGADGSIGRAEIAAQRSHDLCKLIGHQPGVDAAVALLGELRQGAQKANATG